MFDAKKLIPFLLPIVVLGAVTFRHLSYPLLWNDEGETAMFATRVLSFGYPRATDGWNVVNSLKSADPSRGIRQPGDVYVVSGWAQYYVGALGVWFGVGTDDVYLKTFLVRLPFLVSGIAGILIVGLWVSSLLSRRQQWWFAVLYGILMVSCVPLLLHLRQARYYSILLLATALVLAAAWHHLRTGRVWPLAMALIAAFFAYPPALYVLLLACGLFAVWSALRPFLQTAPTAYSENRSISVLPGAWRAVWVVMRPYIGLTLAMIPLATYFRTIGLGNTLGQEMGFGFGAYVQNIATVLSFLSAQIVLPLFFVLRFVRGYLERDETATATRGPRPDQLILVTVIIYTAVVSLTPWFLFERYFIVLYPLVGAVVSLEAIRVWSLVRRGSLPRLETTRGVFVVVPRALLALLVLTLLSSVSGLALYVTRGKSVVLWQQYARELRAPVAGPLDVVIPAIRAAYPSTSTLTIATNYEETVYMFYLGARVVVGYVGNNIEHDLATSPDVVIVRAAWSDYQRELFSFLGRLQYVPWDLAVRDTPFNTIPESRMHWFVTPLPPSHEGEALRVYIRPIEQP